jgi:hypothetical protein
MLCSLNRMCASYTYRSFFVIFFCFVVFENLRFLNSQNLRTQLWDGVEVTVIITYLLLGTQYIIISFIRTNKLDGTGNKK